MRHCGSVDLGRCESVAFCMALLVGCFIGGVVGWPLLFAVGRPLWVGRCGQIALGLSLWVGGFMSVASRWSLLVAYSVALGRSLSVSYSSGESLC